MKKKVAGLLVVGSLLLAIIVPGISQASIITPNNIHGCA